MNSELIGIAGVAALFRPLGRWRHLPSIADRIEVGDCWEWTGRTNRLGYGCVTVNRRKWLVHRFVYEALVRRIPTHLEIDHLCRNPPCCNPDHLEVVTHAVNMRRGHIGSYNVLKTHCRAGHPYFGENLYRGPDGRRYCRTCRRVNNQRARLRTQERSQ